jgi:hypothetical protein
MVLKLINLDIIKEILKIIKNKEEDSLNGLIKSIIMENG